MQGSVWPDYMLAEWAEDGGIDPFDKKLVNPASIDLRWSGRFKVAIPNNTGPLWSETYIEDQLVIKQGEFYLLDTLEYIRMPRHATGQLYLKSSMGRMGYEHSHAGFFDPSFHGSGTLEFSNIAPWPLVIEKGQRIVQLELMQLVAPPERDYLVTGRYNGQSEPTGHR